MFRRRTGNISFPPDQNNYRSEILFSEPSLHDYSRTTKQTHRQLHKIVLAFLQIIVTITMCLPVPPATVVCSSTARINTTEENEKDTTVSGEKRETKNCLSRMMKRTVSRKRPLKHSRSSSLSQSQTCTSITTAATTATTGTEAGTTTNSSPEEFSHDVERRVKFADTVSVRYTGSRYDYAPDELRASWYQQEEYKRIAKECCKQVQKLEKGEILKDQKYCSRGLECHKRQVAISRRKNRKLAVEAVLKEQEEQYLLGGVVVVDEEEISCSYQQVTSSSRLWACVIGLRDQRAAERYLE